MKRKLLLSPMLCIALYGFPQNNLTALINGQSSIAKINAQEAITNASQNVYCPSSGESTAKEYIQLIVFGAIDYVSGNNNGYGDFTSVSTDVTAGQTCTIQGKAGFTGAVRKEVWTVYIDYNADGDFTDAGEMVGSVATNTAFLITKTFKISPTAKNGSTRMRIQMHYNTIITDPCAKFNNGEVEDYTINISGGSGIAANGVVQDKLFSAVSVSPNPVTASSMRLDYMLAKGGKIIFNLTDASGLTRGSYEAGIQNKGNNSYLLNNLSSLHNGNYYITVVQDGTVIGRVLVVIAH